MRILHAIHDFLPAHAAGSEIYAYELAREQQTRGHQAHLLCAEYDPSRQHGSLDWRWVDELPVTEIINNWVFASFDESYQQSVINTQLEHVLLAVQPDVLHLHNLLNLSFDLPRIARAHRIPSVATLHDFTLTCPSGGQRIHRSEQHVCLDIDPQRCARCFPDSSFAAQMNFASLSRRPAVQGPLASLARVIQGRWPEAFGKVMDNVARAQDGPTAPQIETRLVKAREVFAQVELFVAPSRALAEDFKKHGMPAEKIRVSDYGFPPLRATSKLGADRLRIGFVGTMVWHKGAHVLLEAARHLPPESFEILIFGGLETFPQYVADLVRQGQGLPVRFMGSFDRDLTSEIYAQMDVLIVPSLWPENSPLVIHEAFMTGLPVIGARAGGIPDLLNNNPRLLYSPFSAQELAERIRLLIDEPDLIPKLQRSLPGVKTIAQDAEEWDRRYSEVCVS